MAYQPNYGQGLQPMPEGYGQPQYGYGQPNQRMTNPYWAQQQWEAEEANRLGGAMDPSNMYQDWQSEGFIDPRDQYDEATNWEALAAEARKGGDENRARQLELTYGNMSENEINNLKQKADAKGTSDSIYGDMMDIAKQVISGEYQLPESMETDIADSIQSIRGPVLGLIDGLDEIVNTTGKNMKQAITDYESELEKTGTNMMEQLNTSMTKARELHGEAIKNNRNLANMEFDEISEDITKQMMHKSAMMGRATTDPSFNEEMVKNLSNVKSKQEMGLAEFDIAGQQRMSEYETGTKQGITERTGAGREKADLMRGDVDRQTGASLASNQQQRVGLENTLGNQREQMRWNMRTALPQQQLAMGNQAIEGMNRYLYGMPMERMMTAMAPVTGQQTGWMQERQGNRTGSSSTAPGWGSAFGTAVGLGADVAGSFIPG